MRLSALGQSRRDRDLETLLASEIVDVVVVGGGITGVGVALDAATRGLSVALLERADLAAGTSRWSSKLIHGGLRYLATGDVALAYESARERAVLMQRTAPHLTRALPMLMPNHRGTPWSELASGRIGFAAGSGLRAAAGTSRSVLPPPRWVRPARATALVPTLRREDLRGGMVNWEGQLTDDARLVVAVARTAAAYGARIVTHARVTGIDHGEVHVHDGLTGAAGTVRGRTVVNATGVWADRLDPRVELRPSKGAHLVMRGEAFGELGSALVVPVPGERNRYVFVLPQAPRRDGTSRVLVGLTDDAVDAVADVPQADTADQRFLLEVVNSTLERTVTGDDVIGSFAGLRPLLASADGTASADLSRRHRILDDGEGLLTIVGGKLTTYRRMAAEVVDHLVASYRLVAGACVTARQPLVGAIPRRRLAAIPAAAVDIARYGGEAADVERWLASDPDLATPLYDGASHRLADVVWAIRVEGALTTEDVVDGRLRLDQVPEERARAEPVVRAIVEDRRSA